VGGVMSTLALCGPVPFAVTPLGKLFTPHCLIHAILHEEDCELHIKSKNHAVGCIEIPHQPVIPCSQNNAYTNTNAQN